MLEFVVLGFVNYIIMELSEKKVMNKVIWFICCYFDVVI